ncbi:MAG TPA: hypothetical protein VOB72_03180 [Candidatus Dormibacteraeota bacterium]|nr:hypothetical protein [Candidatus Dormibacteraeota bacterium]
MEQTRTGGNALVVPVIVLVIGVVLVLLGQFFLDSLADSSDTWHWIQHGVLFVGGLCVGVGGVRLWASGQR